MKHVHFNSWSAVPDGTYLTKTQLTDLDLPRRPGPLAATVEGRDFRGRKDVIDLYRIDESTPSPASARALAAARSRTGGPDPRTCTTCGSHPERPCTVYQDGTRLCPACEYMRVIRTQQDAQADARLAAAQIAATILAGPLAVVHCQLTDRGLTPSGARRSPAAIRVTALDAGGKQLLDVTVRLVGKRAAGVPAGALQPQDAEPALREAFAGRVRLLWGGTALGPLHQALHGIGATEVLPSGYGTSRDLLLLTTRWRGDLDPRTRTLRWPTDPGRADRMLYLLQQIAAEASSTEAGTA